MNNKGELMNSSPCAMCARFIKASGIVKVIYSNEEGKLVKKCAKDLPFTHLSKGLLRIDNFEEVISKKMKKIFR